MSTLHGSGDIGGHSLVRITHHRHQSPPPPLYSPFLPSRVPVVPLVSLAPAIFTATEPGDDPPTSQRNNLRKLQHIRAVGTAASINTHREPSKKPPTAPPTLPRTPLAVFFLRYICIVLVAAIVLVILLLLVVVPPLVPPSPFIKDLRKHGVPHHTVAALLHKETTLIALLHPRWTYHLRPPPKATIEASPHVLECPLLCNSTRHTAHRRHLPFHCHNHVGYFPRFPPRGDCGDGTGTGTTEVLHLLLQGVLRVARDA